MEEDKRKLWSPSEKRGGRKRIGIAVALIILLAVVASTSIYNMPSNRLARQLNVADKFLAEKNYEQAIVEYMKAIEIDPKAEEALRGLEDTYLAYAQNIAEMGDIEKAVSILKEGHAQIGRESLRLKIEEIEKSQIIEFPFDFKDITIKGYDLLESRFEELCKAFQVEEVREDYYVPKDYGDIKVAALARSENYSENRLLVSSNLLNSSATIEYQEWDEEIGLGMSVNSDDRESGINWCKYISTPIVPGDSYEDWCRIMQVDSIKEKGEKEESGECWDIQTGWGEESASYYESKSNYCGEWKDNYSFQADGLYNDGVVYIGVVVEPDGFISHVGFGYRRKQE